MAGLHSRVDQLFVGRSFSPFGVAAVFFRQSPPSRLSVSDSFLRPLALEFFDNTGGGTGLGKKDNSPEKLICLFLRSLGSDVNHGGVFDAQNKRWLGFAIKHVEGGFVVERKA